MTISECGSTGWIQVMLGYVLLYRGDVGLVISDETLIILYGGQCKKIPNSSSDDGDGRSDALSAYEYGTRLFKLQLDYSECEECECECECEE